MDKVFARVNSTQTSIGEEYLYSMLREIVFSSEDLNNRNRIIEFFQENPDERERIQFILARMGKKRFCNISDYIFGNQNGILRNSIIYKILSMIFILSPFLALVNKFGISLFFISMITNVIMYIKVRGEIVGHLESLGYIVNMISASKRIAKVRIRVLSKHLDVLGGVTRRIKGISISSFYMIFYTTENYLLEFIKIFFLGEPIAFDSIFKLIKKYRAELEVIYEVLGMLDSNIAVASYRQSIDYYIVPDLFKSMGMIENTLDFTDIYHPLISSPVVNSFKTDRSILITGSNASGKSTFLKTVAINAIFAQTIFTCLAKEYKSCYFKTLSSMALKDDLLSNESYYIVEIKSLKRILENLNDDTPCLCIIDEVLRGTNTVERIAASSEILYYLGKNNCICLSATHDIELASILETHFNNYHFQEQFLENKITFDYKLYTGKSYTRNAIKLLSMIGYNLDIVTKADERAKYFLKSGTWGKYNDVK